MSDSPPSTAPVVTEEMKAAAADVIAASFGYRADNSTEEFYTPDYWLRIADAALVAALSVDPREKRIEELERELEVAADELAEAAEWLGGEDGTGEGYSMAQAAKHARAALADRSEAADDVNSHGEGLGSMYLRRLGVKIEEARAVLSAPGPLQGEKDG